MFSSTSLAVFGVFPNFGLWLSGLFRTRVRHIRRRRVHESYEPSAVLSVSRLFVSRVRSV